MKKLLVLVILSVFTINCTAQNKISEEEIPKAKYDKKLADSLGADERGMKSYFLVILKTGSKDATITDKKEREELFKGHFSNMTAMEKSGKLKLAGPFSTKNELGYRGIFLLDVKTEAEAKALLENDPTIKSKIFEVEILPFYGSAAIPMHLKYHHQISK